MGCLLSIVGEFAPKRDLNLHERLDSHYKSLIEIPYSCLMPTCLMKMESDPNPLIDFQRAINAFCLKGMISNGTLNDKWGLIPFGNYALKSFISSVLQKMV